MRRIIPLIIALLLASVSCDKHADERAELHNRIDGINSELERINSSISALQSLINAVQNQDYITEVKDVFQDNYRIGYVIYFLHSDPVTIFNGTDGRDGTDGVNGKDGRNGRNGKDGSAPSIGIKQGSDGYWYWTLNGQLLLDDYNCPFPVFGEDAIAPQVRISNGEWLVSYDGGRTWEAVGSTMTTSDSIFNRIYLEDGYYEFVLSDGSRFQIAKYGEVGVSFDRPFEFNVVPGMQYELKYRVSGVSDTVLVGASATGGIQVDIPYPYAGEGSIFITVPSGFEGGRIHVFVNHSSTVITKTFVLKQI